MKNIVLAVFPALLLAGCSNPYEAEVAEIDSLIVLLDSSKVALNSIDLDEVHRRRDEAGGVIGAIRAGNDTLNRDDVFLYDKFNSHYKAYSKWSMREDLLFEQIEVVPAQLTNLKTDMKKNLLSREEATSYLAKEKQAALGLKIAIEQMVHGLKSIDEEYKFTLEKMKLLVDSNGENSSAGQ